LKFLFEKKGFYQTSAAKVPVKSFFCSLLCHSGKTCEMRIIIMLISENILLLSSNGEELMKWPIFNVSKHNSLQHTNQD